MKQVTRTQVACGVYAITLTNITCRNPVKHMYNTHKRQVKQIDRMKRSNEALRLTTFLVRQASGERLPRTCRLRCMRGNGGLW